MAKYRDKRTVGKSDIVPYKKDEDPKDRHRRRKNTNMAHADELGDWCKDRGIHLLVFNGGHHWQARLGRTMIEWWPSTAKVVMDKAWNQGIHCHDWQQFRGLIEKHIEENQNV